MVCIRINIAYLVGIGLFSGDTAKQAAAYFAIQLMGLAIVPNNPTQTRLCETFSDT
jgi:hypothetical protein